MSEKQFDPSTRIVLALTGLKQSGKDYMIERLREHLSGKRKVVRLSFSDELRTVSHYLFPWCPLNPGNVEKDSPIDHPKNRHNLTPRDIWKIVAHDRTGICYVQDDVLLDMFVRNQLTSTVMNDPDAVYVISDVRKRVEWQMVTDKGFKMIRIMNPACQRPTKEDDVEYLIPHFKVDAEILNSRDDESVERFMQTVKGLFPFLGETDGI